ncbi:SbmA/BacA-like family transporter [Pseudomonas kielensis]|uniref:SbmA/BacA-like family transporter n=1 Tax=Pseudomonas kielensis TaxID=2762577 RepID=UPI0038A4E1DA
MMTSLNLQLKNRPEHQPWVTTITGVIVNAVAYSILLWNISGTLDFKIDDTQVSIPGYMVFAAYTYCALHLWLSHWLGKVLIGLNNHRQTVEADFRYQGMQVREYAEQVAFYRGGDIENKHLTDRFQRVRANTISIINRTFKVMFGQHMFSHLFSLLPTLLAPPLLLNGKITYGDTVRITGAYAMLSNTIAYFPQAYISFTNWLALTNRLRDFQWAINQAENRVSAIEYSHTADESLSCTRLQLHTPTDCYSGPSISSWMKQRAPWTWRQSIASIRPGRGASRYHPHQRCPSHLPGAIPQSNAQSHPQDLRN